MKLSPYQIRHREEQKKKAITLYKQGLTMREVGKMLNMSHSWVALVVREKLSTSVAE